jgi:hypothetical protein
MPREKAGAVQMSISSDWQIGRDEGLGYKGDEVVAGGVEVMHDGEGDERVTLYSFEGRRVAVGDCLGNWAVDVA